MCWSDENHQLSLFLFGNAIKWDGSTSLSTSVSETHFFFSLIVCASGNGMISLKFDL